MKHLKLQLSILVLLTILSVQYSCSEKETAKYSALLTKYNSLLIQNRFLRERLSNSSFKPIVVPKNQRIAFGENYIAAVMMVKDDTLDPFVTVLCNYDQATHTYTSINDTLPFDIKSNSAIFETKPIHKGLNIWAGKVYQNYNGQIREYGFTASYEVY